MYHKWKKLNLCFVCNDLLIYNFLAYLNTFKSSFLDHLCAAHSITSMTRQRSNYVLKVRSDIIKKLNWPVHLWRALKWALPGNNELTVAIIIVLSTKWDFFLLRYHSSCQEATIVDPFLKVQCTVCGVKSFYVTTRKSRQRFHVSSFFWLLLM